MEKTYYEINTLVNSTDEHLYRQIEASIEDLIANIQKEFLLEYDPFQDKFIVKTSLAKEKAEFFEKMYLFRRQSMHSNSEDQSSEDSEWDSSDSDTSGFEPNYWHRCNCPEKIMEETEGAEEGFGSNSEQLKTNESTGSITNSSTTTSVDGDSLLERVLASLRRLESIRKTLEAGLVSQQLTKPKDFEEPKCLKMSNETGKKSQRTLAEMLANIFCPCTLPR